MSETETTPPGIHANWLDRLPLALTVLLAAAITAVFMHLADTHPNISDTVGYTTAGQLLAAGHGLAYSDPHNADILPVFSLYAFQIRRSNDARLFLGFPPGFPLLLAAGIRVGGASAVHFVVPLLAGLAVLVCYWLGELLSGERWVGWWTAVFVALTPAYWEFGTAAWAAVPTLFFVTLGICLYLISRQAQDSKTQRDLTSLLGGGVLVFSLFIRYTNVTIFAALALFELIQARGRLLREAWRWLFFGMLALGCGGILLFNQQYYGGITTTSYSPVHGWYPNAAFSLAYAFGPSFVDGYSAIESGRALWSNLSVWLLLAPVGWRQLNHHRRGAYGWLPLLTTLFGLLLYAVYAFAPVGVNSRFLVPLLPFVAVGIAQAVFSAGQKLPGSIWRWAGATAVLVLLAWPLPTRFASLQARNQSNTAAAAAVANLTARTPPNAVFLSYQLNDQLAVYGRRSVLNYRRIPPANVAQGRYLRETLEPCLTSAVAKLLARGTPVYYYAPGDLSDMWDIMDLLSNTYSLERVEAAGNLYLVHARDDQSLEQLGEIMCPR